MRNPVRSFLKKCVLIGKRFSNCRSFRDERYPAIAGIPAFFFLYQEISCNWVASTMRKTCTSRNLLWNPVIPLTSLVFRSIKILDFKETDFVLLTLTHTFLSLSFLVCFLQVKLNSVKQLGCLLNTYARISPVYMLRSKVTAKMAFLWLNCTTLTMSKR